jgi:hypothetical protein
MAYYSERHFGAPPRTSEEVSSAARDGLLSVVTGRINDGSFGASYPEFCPDPGNNVIGTDRGKLTSALLALAMYSPENNPGEPSIPELFDLIEFTFEKIGKPYGYSHHGFFGHDHLSFRIEEGQAEFRRDINRIFERNGIVFELTEAGQIIRLAPEVLREELASTVFQTGDQDLDSLLEAARSKYLSREEVIRKESLEKLWDAWERLKTVEPGADKRSQTAALLDKAILEPNFRRVAEEEAKVLTNLGNSFMIRHSEVGKPSVADSDSVDYLFHRLFALIRLLLKRTDRG